MSGVQGQRIYAMLSYTDNSVTEGTPWPAIEGDCENIQDKMPTLDVSSTRKEWNSPI